MSVTVCICPKRLIFDPFLILIILAQPWSIADFISFLVAQQIRSQRYIEFKKIRDSRTWLTLIELEPADGNHGNYKTDDQYWNSKFTIDQSWNYFYYRWTKESIMSHTKLLMTRGDTMLKLDFFGNFGFHRSWYRWIFFLSC